MSEYSCATSHCRCTETAEARSFCAKNIAHVHCSCFRCEGKAVYPMTAWRKDSAKSAGFDLNESESPNGEPSLEQTSISADDSTIFASDSYADFSQEYNSGLLFAANAPSPAGSDLENEVEDSDYDSDGGRNQDDIGDDVDGGNGQNEPRDFVTEAILKLLEIKGEAGFSINTFEKLLYWGKVLQSDERRHWPSSWQEVQTILQEIGYKDAKLYWICLDISHPCSYGRMNSKNEKCPYCGNEGNIPYYYLSVVDKVKRWCSSPEMCQQMTAHWKQRNDWLPVEQREGWGCDVKKEIWDGTRFAELSFFGILMLHGHFLQSAQVKGARSLFLQKNCWRLSCWMMCINDAELFVLDAVVLSHILYK